MLFFHGDLHEEVYMQIPQRVIIPPEFKGTNPVCRLVKSLYGLRQAPREWFDKFSHALLVFGFQQSKCDNSLFFIHTSAGYTALLVYVDDIILTGSLENHITEFKDFLNTQFKVKDLGHLNYFLGIKIARSKDGIYIHQRKYALNLLQNTGLLGSKPSAITLPVQHNLSSTTGTPLTDGSSYRRLVGQLIYLTITRPELSYPVHILSQFMAKPTDIHWNSALKLVRYLKNASGQGLLLSANSSLSLQVCCDADWATCPMTRRSVSGFCVLLGNSLLSWKCKKQNVVARSSTESEYRALASATYEV